MDNKEEYIDKIKRSIIDFIFKPFKFSKVSIPPVLLRENYVYSDSKLYDSEYLKYIYDFASCIIDNIDDDNLICFYNNMNNLTVKHVDNFDSDTVLGRYDQYKNIIYLKDDDTSIFHELFHVCSSVNANGISYSGFLQVHKNYYIGSGINEGYTQLLTERYFGHIDNIIDSGYVIETMFMECIEKIVGRERMEELYFNVNLYELIVELNKYSSIDSIMKFISDMDFIRNYSNNCIDDGYILDSLIERMNSVCLFLVRCYFNKIISDMDRDYLTEGELDCFIEFSPGFVIKINDVKYKIPSFDEYIDFLYDMIIVDGDKYFIKSKSNCKKRELKRIYLCR